jgi:hypothetical protein
MQVFCKQVPRAPNETKQIWKFRVMRQPRALLSVSTPRAAGQQGMLSPPLEHKGSVGARPKYKAVKKGPTPPGESSGGFMKRLAFQLPQLAYETRQSLKSRVMNEARKRKKLE